MVGLNLPQSWRCEIAAICTLRLCKNTLLLPSLSLSFSLSVVSPSSFCNEKVFVVKGRVDYLRRYKLLLLKEDTESTPPCGAIPQWRSSFWENEARFLVLECRAVKRRPVGSTLHEHLHCTKMLVTVCLVDPRLTPLKHCWCNKVGAFNKFYFPPLISASCYSFQHFPRRFCCDYNEGRKTEPECDELPFTHLMLDSQMAKRADTLYAFPLLLLSLLPPVRTESIFPLSPQASCGVNDSFSC